MSPYVTRSEEMPSQPKPNETLSFSHTDAVTQMQPTNRQIHSFIHSSSSNLDLFIMGVRKSAGHESAHLDPKNVDLFFHLFLLIYLFTHSFNKYFWPHLCQTFL